MVQAILDLQLPLIVGPDQYDRNGPPITFMIHPGWNHFFSVEVSTDYTLFDREASGSQRTTQNWFDSWSTGLIESSGQTTYTLPLDAWNSLRVNVQTLYYRVVTSADSEGWANFMVSVTDQDAASAPRVVLTGRFVRDPPPPYSPDETLWRTPPG